MGRGGILCSWANIRLNATSWGNLKSWIIDELWLCVNKLMCNTHKVLGWQLLCTLLRVQCWCWWPLHWRVCPPCPAAGGWSHSAPGQHQVRRRGQDPEQGDRGSRCPPPGTDALGHQHLAFHTALELTLYRFYNLQALVAVLRIKYQNFSKCFLPWQGLREVSH